jgi:lysyl-tRNA synthetase class 1
MHWADVVANQLLMKGKSQLISTGISPTGFIHVGSLREAITAEAVRKVLEEREADVRMIYLIDSYDPLRRCYDFLPKSFEEEVGRPISHMPCPCGGHDNYAHHFIQPFLDSVNELGVHCEIYWTHELYQSGTFAETIDMVFQKRERIIDILKEVTGRDVPVDFDPFNPRCEACGRFKGKVTGYRFPFVDYVCECGHEGRADITKGEGKLPWRIEWPAKWKIFGVTCEPFGKDHAAAGGSYDSGVRIAREVFGIEPPHPIPYEFIQLKGLGQMHKSTGSSVSGIDAIRMTPASVLNYNILRYNPERHIDYDSGMGILDLVDEYDRVERMYFEGSASEKEEDLLRAYELSQPNGVRDALPYQVPYRHLVNVTQMSDCFDGIIEVLKRTESMEGIKLDDLKLLEQRVECVRYWLNAFAPENVKFSLAESMPDVELAEAEIEFLRILDSSLGDVEWEGDAIHNVVYEAAKEVGLGAKKGFQALYRIFIERRSGPRLGHFLATLEKPFVMARIAEAISK